jgi:hypothetical protein
MASPKAQISAEELESILRLPNALHLILCFAREGRIAPADAVAAIDRLESEKGSRLSRFLRTPISTLWKH